MRKWTLFRVCNGVAVAALILLGEPSGSKIAIEQSRSLARHEAEILIYLIPDVRQLQTQGKDVEWEELRNPDYNLDDYYFFWVFETSQTAASPNVGHFAVNRWTGDVRETILGKRIESPLLNGVQDILRRAHHIDEDAIAKFRDRSLEATRGRK